MDSTKMYCRFFHSDAQLEKYIELNAIAREEIFSISPYSSYRGNGISFTGQYLYFFTERLLSFDVFNNLKETRQSQITTRLEDISKDHEFQMKLFKLSEKDMSWCERLYNRGGSLAGAHRKLIFCSDIKNEPIDIMDFLNDLIRLNPGILKIRSFC